MPLPLSPLQIASACAIVAFGALVQGSVGFGAALVAAPVLVLIDPIFVPGPMIVSGLVLSSVMGMRERRAIHFLGLRTAVPGLLAGSSIAAILLTRLTSDAVGVTLGILVILAVLLSLAGLQVRTTATNVFYASTLAGFMSTTASIPGPPLALLYQHSGGPRLRATLAPLFIVCAVISLVTLTVVDRFGQLELVLGMMLAPGVVAGVALSTFTARLLDRGPVRYAVLILAAAAGGAAIVKNTW